MPKYPQLKLVVTHDASDTELQSRVLSAIVTRRENKGSDLVMQANDNQGMTFLEEIEVDDIIQLSYKDETLEDWVQIFGGYAVEITPDLKEGTGELVQVKAYGVECCLDRMRVCNEYGSESKNAKRTESFDLDLAIDDWNEVHKDWGSTGADPWLDTDDGDTSCIATVVNEAALGYYMEEWSFGNLSAEYDDATISSAILYAKGKIYDRVDQVQVRFYVWNGTSWVNAGDMVFNSTSYTEDSLDVSSILNTLAKVNGAKIKVELSGYGGDPGGQVYLTYARLHMEGTGEIGVSQTLLNILTNAEIGIIPNYVEKVLATATDSEYDVDTTYIHNETTELKYLYFPYTPANDAIRALLELLTAMRYSSAGLHWLMVPNGKSTPWLCIDIIGNHTTASTKWPHDCPVDPEIGTNVTDEHYETKKLEGNYVVYFGKYEWPTRELMTEYSAALWVRATGINDPTDETSDYKAGEASLRFPMGDTGASFAEYYYPSTQDLALDIEKIGTKRTPATLCFYVKNVNITGLSVYMGTNKGVIGFPHCFEKDITSRLPGSGKWGYVEVPIGEFMKNAEQEWDIRTGTPDWAEIDYVGFKITRPSAGTSYLLVDDMFVRGIITRAALDSDSISARRCTIKLVTDSLAKSADTIAADDTGTVARLAKAELLRSLTTPIIGQVVLNALKPTVLPGQICHAHGRRKAAGGYWIDKDMRVTEVQHVFRKEGALTTMELTDDLLNSYPVEPTNSYNAILKASNPDYQDRDRGNLKGRDIDIDQEILAKDY